MKIGLGKIIYGLSLVLGIFLSYYVLGMLLYNFTRKRIPFPHSWDKNNLISVGIFIALPILSIVIYKLRLNTFDRIFSFTFFVFWVIALYFLVRSIT